MILANFQKSLLRDNTKISATLQEGKVEEDEIPTRLQILFKKLGGLDK
jgi:hypothetical protein